MIRKTDRFLKRKARVWGCQYNGLTKNDKVVEIVRRETWWLFWIVPIFSIDTVVDKPR